MSEQVGGRLTLRRGVLARLIMNGIKQGPGVRTRRRGGRGDRPMSHDDSQHIALAQTILVPGSAIGVVAANSIYQRTSGESSRAQRQGATGYRRIRRGIAKRDMRRGAGRVVGRAPEHWTTGAFFHDRREYIARRQEDIEVQGVARVVSFIETELDRDEVSLIGVQETQRRLPTIPRGVIRENQHLAQTVGGQVNGACRRVQAKASPA